MTKTTFLTNLKERYWPLIKSLQTFLLLVTGVAGYMSFRCPVLNWAALLGLTGSLFLAISGSTVLNMWFDRDIDAKMQRTCWRPLPSGRVSPREALALGLILSVLGVGWALWMDFVYGMIVFAGLFFDVVVYTVWLKRRTAWSIVWGGISGGVPVLAGRTLAYGQVDIVGLLLACAVLFWIPTHIMTFSLRYKEDYDRAGVPTFPLVYGEQFTHWTIAISSVIAALTMAAAAVGIGMTIGHLRLIAVLSSGLLMLAVGSTFYPSEKINFGLFKYASIYMLSAMVLMIMEAF